MGEWVGGGGQLGAKRVTNTCVPGGTAGIQQTMDWGRCQSCKDAISEEYAAAS